MRTYILVTLIALGVLSTAPVFAQAVQAGSTQDADGNVVFTFNGAPSIRLAPAGVAAGANCPATSAGAIRFNTVSRIFEGCDGVVWNSFSSSAATALSGSMCGMSAFYRIGVHYNPPAAADYVGYLSHTCGGRRPFLDPCPSNYRSEMIIQFYDGSGNLQTQYSCLRN